MSKGIVYVLINEGHSGIVKVGKSKNLGKRIKVHNTSVPYPYRCFYAVEVEGYEAKEKAIKRAFEDFNVKAGGGTEFFRILPERVAEILKILGGKTVMDNNAVVEEEGGAIFMLDEREIAERKAHFTFSELQIPLKAELTFVSDKTKRCRVKSERTVEYDGVEQYLSPLAEKLLGELGWRSKVAGSLYFEYKGEILSDIRDRLEREAEEARGDELTERMARFTFAGLQIPDNAELVFIYDETKTCRVKLPNKVEYSGEIFSLSALAQKLLSETKGYNWRARGTLYFKYEGEILQERRARLESAEEGGVD